MKDYIIWKFGEVKLRNEAIEGMNMLAEREKEIIEEGDTTKFQYITTEPWSQYPWVDALFKKAELVIGQSITGIAADVGSGTGIGAAALSKFDKIKEVYAIDYSEEHVRSIMPLTFKHFDADEGKITRIVGDFNNIKTPDNFFDSIFGVGALHHSENLDFTLKELRRVLKPSGHIILADRAYPNRVTDEFLNGLLDTQMTDKQKKMWRLPKDFTRRMWGEHEYRLSDWRTIFNRCGFKVYHFRFIGKGPLLLRIPFRIFFSLFGDLLLKQQFNAIPYYRWFLKYFKGPNTLIVAKKI